jgi:uncharacterized membrane protein YdjX (TVP38/TMEM64 family)
MKASGQVWFKLLALVLALGAIALAEIFLDIPARLQEALVWIEKLGWAGIGAYIVLYVLACVLFVPGSILTLGAGLVFGVLKGSVIVSAAATLGAGAAFLFGRYLARGWISGLMKGNRIFQALDSAVAAEGGKIVFLTRLSPVFPFNLLNYAFGLTQVRFQDYIFASWLGMLPGTVLYVYLGSLAGDLAALGRARPRSQLEWIFYGVGLLAALAVTGYVTRLAKNALKKKITEAPHA